MIFEIDWRGIRRSKTLEWYKETAAENNTLREEICDALMVIEGSNDIIAGQSATIHRLRLALRGLLDALGDERKELLAIDAAEAVLKGAL